MSAPRQPGQSRSSQYRASIRARLAARRLLPAPQPTPPLTLYPVGKALTLVAVQCERCVALVVPGDATYGEDGRWRCADETACDQRRGMGR